jgi:hypothetical protein
MGVKLGLTSREEYIMKVFENRVMRIMSEPKRDEIRGRWRKLHNEKFRNLNASPNIIRKIM